MSPEQARGSRDIGPSSDLWSFSATLYEALVGAPPFIGENYNAIMYAIQHQDAAPITVCDVDLAGIVARGLRRDPLERWGSARELAATLAAWLLSRGTEADICGHSVHHRALRSDEGGTASAPLGSSGETDSGTAACAPVIRRLANMSRTARRRVLGKAAASVALVLALAGSAFAAKLFVDRSEAGTDAAQSEVARAPEDPSGTTFGAGTSPPAALERPASPAPVLESKSVATRPIDDGTAAAKVTAPKSVRRVVAPMAKKPSDAPAFTAPAIDVPRGTPHDAPPVSSSRSSNKLDYDFGF
jgi:hypothetical protein